MLPDHAVIGCAIPSSWPACFAMTSLPLPSRESTRRHRHSLALQPLAPAPPALQPIPNNLGPTLLLALGLPLVPLLIGVPLVLVGLAGIRDAQGEQALPWLAHRLPALVGWWRASS